MYLKNALLYIIIRNIFTFFSCFHNYVSKNARHVLFSHFWLHIYIYRPFNHDIYNRYNVQNIKTISVSAHSKNSQ